MTTVFSASRLRLSIEAALYKVETERDGHALQKAKGNVFSFSQESLDEAKLHEYCHANSPRREELELLWLSDVRMLADFGQIVSARSTRYLCYYM